jgi:peroxiredoxin
MRVGRLVLAAVLAAVALAGCGRAASDAGCSTGADGWIRCAPGERPALEKVVGELLDGGRYALSDQRGQVVVVNFWGSWCAPCRAEADDLEETFQATRALGVAFVGINHRDDRDKAKAFEAGRVTYPSLFDPDGRLAMRFEPPPNATPATFVLDRQGRVAALTRDAVRRETLEPVVAEVAAESGPR